MNKLLLAFILLFTLDAHCADSPKRTFRFGGLERTYRLQLPSATPPKNLPLLFALHGGMGSGGQLEGQTGLSDLAKTRKFIVVYPDSTGKQWNDGRPEADTSVNDVGFLKALAQELAQEFSVDKNRVLVVGISNGGMMAQRLACEASDTFRAFAVVSALMPKALAPHCVGSPSISLLFLNSVDDPLMPWKGGVILSGRFAGKGGYVISGPETLRLWQEKLGCQDKPAGKTLPDRKDDGTTVEHLTYAGCKAGRLEQYKITGGGHPWPSTKVRPLLRRFTGTPTQEIGNQEILEFLGL